MRNATAVLYPRSASGGALAVYPSIRSQSGANAPGAVVYKADEGIVRRLHWGLLPRKILEFSANFLDSLDIY